VRAARGVGMVAAVQRGEARKAAAGAVRREARRGAPAAAHAQQRQEMRGVRGVLLSCLCLLSSCLPYMRPSFHKVQKFQEGESCRV